MKKRPNASDLKCNIVNLTLPMPKLDGTVAALLIPAKGCAVVAAQRVEG